MMNLKVKFDFSHIKKNKERGKGMLKTRFRTENTSPKKTGKSRILKNHKMLNHNGLLKRLRIVLYKIKRWDLDGIDSLNLCRLEIDICRETNLMRI